MIEDRYLQNQFDPLGLFNRAYSGDHSNCFWFLLNGCEEISRIYDSWNNSFICSKENIAIYED